MNDAAAMPPPILPPLREVIAKHGLDANKALGQNFLLDEQLLGRIAAVPGSLDGQNVFEVGPGPGGLTRALLRAGAQVTVIERDSRCIPALEELSEAFPNKLTIIEGDALEINPSDYIDGHFHILSNLPYNIGSALTVKWLSEKIWPPKWLSLTLMFQKEVADRIVAVTGSKAYGRLSILAGWRSEARIAMKVHRSAFTPAPKVMSAIVHITPNVMPDNVRLRTLENITAQAFGQRRKMLRQSLKSIPNILAALDAVGISPTDRAEVVSIDKFIELAHYLERDDSE